MSDKINPEEIGDLEAPVVLDDEEIGKTGDLLEFGMEVDADAWDMVASLPDFFWEGTDEDPAGVRADAKRRGAETREQLENLRAERKARRNS